jgi:hypothetical protein
MSNAASESPPPQPLLLPGLRFSELTTEDPALLLDSYDLPATALAEVPADLRQPAP